MTQLFCHPPRGFGIKTRFERGRAQRNARHTPRQNAQIIIAFEIRAFRQHDIRPAGDFRGHDVDRHEQIEILHRLDGFLRLGQCEQEISAIHNPTFEIATTRDRRNRRVADAVCEGMTRGSRGPGWTPLSEPPDELVRRRIEPPKSPGQRVHRARPGQRHPSMTLGQVVAVTTTEGER